MFVHEGLIAAFNYAGGPALIYESPATLDIIAKTGDPYIVIVPDTIPLKQLFSTDTRHVRGFVLAHCEKDSLFTTFVTSQKRAAVRCVPAILDDIREGRLKNGDMIAVDGVNGKVFVQPDAETVARFEALRGTGAPEVTKEHIPRLAREAMQTANIPELPPMMRLPEFPDMLKRDTWSVAPGPSVTPKDMPTPAEIRREVELGFDTAKSAYAEARLKTWQTVALVAVSLFRDKLLEPDELELLNNAVADEVARLDALKPPPPPPPAPREKTHYEKWGLTPLREGERDPNEKPEEEQARRGRRKLEAEAPKALPAPEGAGEAVATETE